MVMIVFCRKCGRKLHTGASFCTFCGERVIEEKENVVGNEAEKENVSNLIDEGRKEKDNISKSYNSTSNNDEADNKEKSIKDKIIDGIYSIIMFFLVCAAAGFGKEIVHDPSVMKVLEYVVPGILIGIACAVVVIFINNQFTSKRIKYKLVCIIACALAGAIGGIYIAVMVSVISGVVMYFATNKSE